MIIPVVQRFGIVILMLVMGTASLRSGLFFDEDLYVVSTLWGAACLLLAAGNMLLERNKDFSMDCKSMMNPLFILAGIMLLIYLWHGLHGALSTEGTGKEIIRWGLFGSVGFVAWAVGREHGGKRLLRLVWHMTGMILCGSALLAVYGLMELPYGLFRSADPAVSATGARLGGLLQYPNTFGAVMAAFLLERLFALPAAFRGRTTPLGAAAALLPLAPYTAALLLTESRGAWVAAALACAAGLAADRRGAAPIFAAAAAPVAGAALLYRQLADAQLAPVVLPGLLWLAGLWAGGVLAGLLLCRAWRHSPPGCSTGVAESPAPVPAPIHLLAPAPIRPSAPAPIRPSAPAPIRTSYNRQPLIFITASALYIIAFIAVLSRVKTRLGGGLETVSARRLMYRDAWELFRSAPWLGQGGDTWRLSYRSVQTQPYVGAEVHSGYLDLLLNTGAVGCFLVLVLLIRASWRLGVTYPRLLPPFLALVLHSIIDFDWSFGLVWLLIFWIAAMGSGLNEPGKHPTSNRETWIDGCRIPFFRFPTVFRNFRVYQAFLLTGIACLTAWTILASTFWIGDLYYRQGLQEINRDEREQLLTSAMRWNPASTQSAVLLAELLPAEQAAPLLMRSLILSPGHPELTWAMAELQVESGNSRQAAAWYRISLGRDRYNASKQTNAVLSLADIARSQWAAGKDRAAVRTAYCALEIYESYRSSVDLMSVIAGVRNDRDFRITFQAEREWTSLRRWVQETSLHMKLQTMDSSVLFTPSTK